MRRTSWSIPKSSHDGLSTGPASSGGRMSWAAPIAAWADGYTPKSAGHSSRRWPKGRPSRRKPWVVALEFPRPAAVPPFRAVTINRRYCALALTRCDQRRRPMMHLLRYSFDAYFGRIIGSHASSFARTMSRRRAPERHDGHWGLAAEARAAAIRAGFPRERDRPTRPAGADGRRSERTWRCRDRPSSATAESDR